jgi:protein-tyrosine phosphatase
MIDIHSHILPGLDDGSRDLEESLAMAKEAVREGIDTIVATPHHANGKYWNDSTQVRSAVSLFREALEKHNIPLDVLEGQEIRVYQELLEDIQSGSSIMLAGSSYILLEFPSSRIPDTIEDVMHELRLLGITPVIAHPERNAEIAQCPDKLLRLIQLGALSQVTSHSINGLFGKSIQECTVNLCRRNLVHFVSSDAHNMSNRAFGLGAAYDAAAGLLGHEYVTYYQANAESLIRSQSIEIWEPSSSKSRKWYQFWK